MKRLDGQVAIVTGASRGIGRSIAKELAEWGAAVVVDYLQSRQLAEALVDELTRNGQKAIAVQADVCHSNQVRALVERTLGEFGRIDILVNNAGVNRDRTLLKMSADDWHAVIGTDLDGVFYCTRAVLPHMIQCRYGRIISVSSVIGHTGNFGQANYSAAKAGVIAFTKSAAQELARYSITANVVCPGFVETDMVGVLPDDVKRTLLARIPLGRFGRPDEVASLVRYLVTEGDWITGQQFNVNGGMHM